MSATPFNFEVVPGVRIGPFCLGAPIGAVTSFLQREFTCYTEVQLFYSADTPRSTPITIQLPQCGAKLVFDQRTQQLEAVHIYNAAAVTLSHNNDVFSNDCAAPIAGAGSGGWGGKGSPPPAAMIFAQKHFGPTTPPLYDAHDQAFQLHYPGLTARFPVAEAQRQYFDGSSSSSSSRFDPTSTLACPDGTVQLMGSVSVHRAKRGAGLTTPNAATRGGGAPAAKGGGEGGRGGSAAAASAAAGSAAGSAATVDAVPAFYGENVAVREGVGLEFKGRGA